MNYGYLPRADQSKWRIANSHYGYRMMPESSPCSLAPSRGLATCGLQGPPKLQQEPGPRISSRFLSSDWLAGAPVKGWLGLIRAASVPPAARAGFASSEEEGGAPVPAFKTILGHFDGACSELLRALRYCYYMIPYNSIWGFR